ncbi:MAG: alpha-glucosidase [Chloroflexota bacterium]|jgi:alpha-glucosidase|nr:alpha-glucosidase [Chloroflexota bacterium]
MTIAEQPRATGADTEWWQRGVIYQIYPRSFADSDGNGVGDLPGIIAHLDHIESLGVDAIWLSPIYPSPGLDLGYDVADHTAVDPLFGTMADFDRLVAAAHGRGLKVILDLVLNHTSDRNAWFEDSRTGRTGEHADWYLWRDPAGWRRGRPIPPNNWVSFFGGSAWAWEPARKQFYMHTFLKEQPDLNWREPAVRAAQLAMIRGWLDRGVDGFRLDVFNTFFKEASLAPNPPRTPAPRGLARFRGWNRQLHVNDKDQPELADFLAEFRAIVDEVPGRMTVGELFDDRPERAALHSGPRHLIFDFGLIRKPWRAESMADAIDDRETAFGPDRWPAVVLSNHDQPRQATRFARGPQRDAVAKAAAVLLLTLRGTPFMYYGEEIGLGDIKVPRREIVDPPARRYWPLPLWWNRDGCRAPMPWTGGPNGGFSTGRPWLRMAPDFATRNVAGQASDPDSVLSAYRRLVQARRTLPAIQTGSFRWVVRARDDVLAYRRDAPGEAVLVAINFSGEAISVPLTDPATTSLDWELRYSTVASGRLPVEGLVLRLAAHEAAILRAPLAKAPSGG